MREPINKMKQQIIFFVATINIFLSANDVRGSVDYVIQNVKRQFT